MPGSSSRSSRSRAVSFPFLCCCATRAAPRLPRRQRGDDAGRREGRGLRASEMGRGKGNAGSGTYSGGGKAGGSGRRARGTAYHMDEWDCPITWCGRVTWLRESSRARSRASSRARGRARRSPAARAHHNRTSSSSGATTSAIEPQLLHPRPDGLSDAQHRPDRQGRHAVHRLLRRAILHRRPLVLHHRPERVSHRPFEGRHSRPRRSA